MISIQEKIKWQEWLKSNPTRAELNLSHAMQNHETLKDKFEPQALVHGFIVDFYFSKAKLVIEVDGSIHIEKKQIEYDKKRTKILNGYGVTVLRISNDRIYSDVKKVLFKIISTFSAIIHRNYYKNLDNVNKKHKKRSFIEAHCCKYQSYSKGSGSMRRKINPARASNPKSANKLLLTQRPKGWV